MEFDVMTRSDTWDNIAGFARDVEAAGVSGILFTESGQVPWMTIAAAAQAAPSLHCSTGIAVAFPRSPMISAQIAWEMAANTRGKFRLGLGSQVRPHVVRRYGVALVVSPDVVWELWVTGLSKRPPRVWCRQVI